MNANVLPPMAVNWLRVGEIRNGELVQLSSQPDTRLVVLDELKQMDANLENMCISPVSTEMLMISYSFSETEKYGLGGL